MFILFLKGYILYTIGGATILVGLVFLFPQIMVKEATKEATQEKIKRMKNPRAAAVIIVIGIVLLVLGYVFKF